VTFLQIVASAVLILSVIALIWPYTCYPLILRTLSERQVAMSATAPADATLLFCAFNEIAAIDAKIANLRSLRDRYPQLRIMAYDDGSTDGTHERLAAASAVVTLVTGEGRKGKAHGMKRLAGLADTNILIFTDANVRFDPAAINELLRPYADPAVGGVLGTLCYDRTGSGPTERTGSLYWRLEEWLKSLESRTGNVMGADGSIFSVRRTLYPEFPDSVLDDLTVSMAVVFAGFRLIKSDRALAFEDVTSDRGDEFRRKQRIAARSWHTHGYLRPQLRAMTVLDRFKYGSRKIARRLGGLSLSLAMVAALVLAWSLGVWFGAAATAMILIAILLSRTMRTGPIAAIGDILSAYCAVLIGGWQALRGKRYVTWTPPASR